MTHQLIARTDDTTMDEQFGKHLQVLSLILINIELIHDAMLFGAVISMKIINVYFVLKQCVVNHLLFLMLIDFYLISSTTSNNWYKIYILFFECLPRKISSYCNNFILFSGILEGQWIGHVRHNFYLIHASLCNNLFEAFSIHYGHGRM